VSRLNPALAILLACVCSAFSAPASAASPAVLRRLLSVNVAALAASADRLYVAGFDQGLFSVERDATVRSIHDAALSPHINALVWSEPTQSLWLGTARGLVRCQMSRAATCRRIGPTSAVHALLLDDGDAVVAGGDAGLLFVTAETTRVFGKKQGAPFRSVWALAQSAGALFVGSTNGLFWGAPRTFGSGGAKPERASVVIGNLPDDWVTALLRQGDRLFVGTYNAGVVRFRLDAGQLLSDGADPALGYVNPAGLAVLDENTLAFASMDGLRTGSLGQSSLIATNNHDVTAVVPAIGGGYWVGTRQGLEWHDL
jgi:ligand-binding sensor domain-containing protein